MLPWFFLVLAGVCEMAWPIGYKYTEGFARNVPAIAATVAVMVVSFLLMMAATRDPRMHVGTAYAVWTGLGAGGTAVLGMIMFNEPRSAARLACLTMVVLGVIGLKFVTPAADVKKVDSPVATVSR
jgi:quaternary ammonium compound-resistance protein SugE